MNLVTPDSGLIFWMTLIFAIVFVILAKFGFPVITGMVDKRQEKIEGSLRDAQKAREEVEHLQQLRDQMIAEAHTQPPSRDRHFSSAQRPMRKSKPHRL